MVILSATLLAVWLPLAPQVNSTPVVETNRHVMPTLVVDGVARPTVEVHDYRRSPSIARSGGVLLAAGNCNPRVTRC